MQPVPPRSFLLRTGLLLAGLVCCALLYAVTAQPRGKGRPRPRRFALCSDDGTLCTPDSEAAPLDGPPARARQQHLAKLGVERWHAQGCKGKGFKIALLDSGFRGYKAHLGKA